MYYKQELPYVYSFCNGETYHILSTYWCIIS